MTAAVPRTRTRNLQVDATPAPRARQRGPVVSDAIKQQAVDFYEFNKQANSFRSKADAKRKELYTSMKSASVQGFEASVHEAGELKLLTVEVVTPEVNYIDVNELEKLVTPEQFRKIIQATKGAVEAEVGKTIATRCERSRAGTEVVNVKPKK